MISTHTGVLAQVGVPNIPAGTAQAALWLCIGIFGGIFMISFLASKSAGFRSFLLNSILKGNKKAGWILAQIENRYELLPLSSDDAGDYYVKYDGDKHFVDDKLNLMHTLEGIPFGLWHFSDRPVGDVEHAAAGAAEAQKEPDGGWIADSERMTLQDIKNQIVIGRRTGENGRTLVFCNPFHKRADEPDIVDTREMGKLMVREQESDTPRKAAANAKEAERAFDRFEGIKRTASLIIAFMAGSVATLMGGSGGGGGGVSVPIQTLPVAPADLVGVLPL